MGKSKETTNVTEEKLDKALLELEETVKKGDALLSHPTEGGKLAGGTGKALSKKAPKGRSGEIAKMMSASDRSSDDESSDDASFKKKKKKVKKGEDASSTAEDEAVAKAAASSDSSSDDESSGDDDSSSPAEKSLLERAESSATLRKGINVTGFLRRFMEVQSEVIEGLRKSMLAEIGALREEVAAVKAAIPEPGSVEMVEGGASAVGEDLKVFNRKLAKAVSFIGNDLEEVHKGVADIHGLLAKILRQPHVPERRSVVSKSEIVPPPGGEGAEENALAQVDHHSILESLYSRLEKGAITEDVIIKYERGDTDPRTGYSRGQYDVSLLPQYLQKALQNELCK